MSLAMGKWRHHDTKAVCIQTSQMFHYELSSMERHNENHSAVTTTAHPHYGTSKLAAHVPQYLVVACLYVKDVIPNQKLRKREEVMCTDFREPD